jgi:hypothetical protein
MHTDKRRSEQSAYLCKSVFNLWLIARRVALPDGRASDTSEYPDCSKTDLKNT